MRDFVEMDRLTRGCDTPGRAVVEHDDGDDGRDECRDHNGTAPRNHGVNDIRVSKRALASLPNVASVAALDRYHRATRRRAGRVWPPTHSTLQAALPPTHRRDLRQHHLYQ